MFYLVFLDAEYSNILLYQPAFLSSKMKFYVGKDRVWDYTGVGFYMFQIKQVLLYIPIGSVWHLINRLSLSLPAILVKWLHCVLGCASQHSSVRGITLFC